MQIFKKYLRRENFVIDEYMSIYEYSQIHLQHEIISMNDTDVVVFKSSTEENIEVSEDQKYFQNSIT
jgi:hypothetical protein